MSRVTRRVRAGAFTLVEILLVISIFVLILAVAVPSFSSMLYTSDQSLAENSVRGGLLSARDVAIRSASGQDSAAVFFHENGRTSIVPCTLAGKLDDLNSNNQAIVREVFVPAAGFEPAQLPRGWSVRGLATPGTISADWYESYRQILGANVVDQGSFWLLPETAYFDINEPHKGEYRQTFMVRFEGGTGRLKLGDTAPVLVLAPSPGASFRSSGVFAQAGCNPLLEADLQRFVRRILAAPATGPGGQLQLTAQQKRQILGDLASDTVLAKPVFQMAVASEKRLLAAIGITPDRFTQTMYKADGLNPTFEDGPEFVTGVDVKKLELLNDWLKGDIDVEGRTIESDARMFTIQRYLGTPQEILQ